MRISDLGRACGVPVATIKFYLREGLLPTGTRTARNQAEYDDDHLARLRVIRTLTGAGGLSLSAVREMLAAIDDTRLSAREQSRAIGRALLHEEAGPVGEAAARASVDGFVAERGWRLGPDSPGPDTLARVLAALRNLGRPCDASMFTPHADAAEKLAEHEHELFRGGPEAALVATVLFDVALAAMRRMAHENLLMTCSTR